MDTFLALSLITLFTFKTTLAVGTDVKDQIWRQTIENQHKYQYKLLEKLTTMVEALLKCENGYNKLKDQCFKYIESPHKNFAAAAKFCQAEGAHLAESRSQEQNDFINGLIQHSSFLGGTADKNGVWTWKSTGDEISSGCNNWSPLRPLSQTGNGNGNDCLVINAYAKYAGKWFDTDCTASGPFVCQKPVA